MAASIQFHPLEVPRYLTEIHIVLPVDRSFSSMVSCSMAELLQF